MRGQTNLIEIKTQNPKPIIEKKSDALPGATELRLSVALNFVAEMSKSQAEVQGVLTLERQKSANLRGQ